MTTESTKIQKLSDKVLEILERSGLGKVFNWEDYHYFKKQSQNAQNQAEAIAELFQYWYSNETSDFADYEF